VKFLLFLAPRKRKISTETPTTVSKVAKGSVAEFPESNGTTDDSDLITLKEIPVAILGDEENIIEIIDLEEEASNATKTPKRKVCVS
jgi:hypothetical protein